ncbi:MAG: hypothetical protein IPK58_22610 [Acidobacteria bacterium]|nr:hypothetical protein [Acidobacteriota bacterium]
MKSTSKLSNPQRHEADEELRHIARGDADRKAVDDEHRVADDAKREIHQELRAMSAVSIGASLASTRKFAKNRAAG